MLRRGRVLGPLVALCALAASVLVACGSGGPETATDQAQTGVERGGEGTAEERQAAQALEAAEQRQRARRAAKRRAATAERKRERRVELEMEAERRQREEAKRAEREAEEEAEEAPPSCHPSYEGACLEPTASDYDCAGGSGDGPLYTGTVYVVGPDDFGLDRDGDGVACEA